MSKHVHNRVFIPSKLLIVLNIPVSHKNTSSQKFADANTRRKKKFFPQFIILVTYFIKRQMTESIRRIRPLLKGQVKGVEREKRNGEKKYISLFPRVKRKLLSKYPLGNFHIFRRDKEDINLKVRKSTSPYCILLWRETSNDSVVF